MASEIIYEPTLKAEDLIIPDGFVVTDVHIMVLENLLDMIIPNGQW